MMPKERTIHNVYHYVRSTASQTLGADGGDTNAEITEHTATQLCKVLSEMEVLNEASVFMDGGCAYNVFASHVAQAFNCKVWGCEYVPTRIYLGTFNMLQALQDPHEIGELINPKIAYVLLDLFKLTLFRPTTVAYFFDEAFPEALVEHNCVAAVNTGGLEYVLSYKASKHPKIHEVFQQYGFVLCNKVQVTKCGSGESNTIYIYQRALSTQAFKYIMEYVSAILCWRRSCLVRDEMLLSASLAERVPPAGSTVESTHKSEATRGISFTC